MNSKNSQLSRRAEKRALLLSLNLLTRVALGLSLLAAAAISGCQANGEAGAGDPAYANPSTKPYKPIYIWDPSDVRIPSGGRTSR